MTENFPIGIYVNKIENRITFRIKTGFYLELLTPETINYLAGLKVRYLRLKMVRMCLI